MKRNKTQLTPPVLDRYEMKYIVSEDMVGPMSDYLSIYCSLDKYSENTEDSFYPIHSIYLDTPSYLFVKNRMLDVMQRFNMRIRTYSKIPKPPYFFEIKYKTCNIVRKYRAVVQDTDLTQILRDSDDLLPDSMDEKSRENFRLFQRLVYTYNAEPKTLVQYRRKAFVSDCDEYGRVTFDKELKFMQKQQYDFGINDAELKEYKGIGSMERENPADKIILELKCNVMKVPLWMMDLIRIFRLQKSAFSKYTNSVRETMQENVPPSLYSIFSPNVKDLIR